MAENNKKTSEIEAEKDKPIFDYKHSMSFKLSDSFKNKYVKPIRNGVASITSDGLVALGHIKGMWKCETEILQFPNKDNGNICICRSTVGGYDYDPTTDSIIKVEYSDIADASPSNCSNITAPAFIRMASTRSLGRALRRYTNASMVCDEELTDETSTFNPADQPVSIDKLQEIQNIIKTKQLSKEVCEEIMMKTLNTTDFNSLTQAQANQIETILSNYVAPAK